MTLKITDNVAQRLQRMRPAPIMAAFGEELQAGAEAIVERAQFNIRDGAISGLGHIAGLPGDFPNANTHELDESIHAGELVEGTNEVRAAAIADAPYAAFVELGTSRMEPRPYMEPSTEELRPEIIHSLNQRFRDEVGIGG